ncbi:MAG: hypothetical protein HYS06_10125 [Methylocystis sp.]|nr:hypothetical protein [Methylocystis sp.]
MAAALFFKTQGRLASMLADQGKGGVNAARFANDGAPRRMRRQKPGLG